MARTKKVEKPEISTDIHGLIVYADFAEYKAGDVFTLPEGWARDENYEKLIVTKSKSREGMVFVTDKGGRAVLPVKEM